MKKKDISKMLYESFVTFEKSDDVNLVSASLNNLQNCFFASLDVEQKKQYNEILRLTEKYHHLYDQQLINYTLDFCITSRQLFGNNDNLL